MGSLVGVFNGALLKLGEDRIVSPDDPVPGAVAFRDVLERVRRHELTRYRWKFAIARVELAAESVAPAFGFARQFVQPVDMLRVLQVGDEPLRQPAYQREGGRILTDAEAPLRVRYLRDVADASGWSADFEEVLACRLAFEVCERVTQSSTRKRDLFAELREARKDARRAGAIEAEPQPLPDEDPWTLARY